MCTDKGETENVRRFVQSLDIPYPIVMAPSEVQQSYRVAGLPTAFLIDKEGHIKEKFIGFNAKIGKQMTARIEALISTTP